MREYFIQMVSNSEPFTDELPLTARDAFFGSAFERQHALVKQYDNKRIVRSINPANNKNVIIFTVDGVEKERWTLKRKGFNLIDWLRSLVKGQ